MRAAIYTRISDDTTGLGLGVARQEADCRDLCQRLGWTVADVFSDNDTSAFTRRPRPAYERMLVELEAGRLDALVCWDVDRLTRHPIELERIIDLADRHNVGLASVGGEIDLLTPQGRLTARIKASVARHEVEQSSRRIKRKVLERAQAGKPHGKAAFGWRRIDGRDVLVPEEAALVREMAERIILGESMRQLTLDLERRGIPTPDGGGKWHPVMVRQLVMRERNAGLRRHQKQVIGKGDWQPIFDEDTYNRVRAILTDPRRRSSPGSQPKHLLSGIAFCGTCGAPVRILVAHGTRPKAYVCSAKSCVRRKQVAVDELIEALVIRRLSQPDGLQALAVGDVSDLEDEAAAIRARLDLAADQFSDGLIDGTQLARITAKLKPQFDEVQARLRGALAVPELADLAGPLAQERWQDVPLARKRAAVSSLMEIRILAIGKTGRAEFDPAGVEVTWKAGAAPAVPPPVPA